MNGPFNFEVEPFEFEPELAQTLEEFNLELNSAMQGEVRRRRRKSPRRDALSKKPAPPLKRFPQRPRIDSNMPVSRSGDASTPTSAPSTADTEPAETTGFVVRGIVLPPPTNLNVTNFNDGRIQRFPGRNRRGRVVDEFIVHETVTRSVADTVNVLSRRKLGVHLILGPDGAITQHGDLADDRLGHAGLHNPVSVGIEVVNPYYPRYLRPGMPWTRVINAGWAHEGRYVVPTPPQAEAVARLIAWLTSPAAEGLSIPRTWIGFSNGKLAMNRVPGAEQLKPGIYAHTYFGHADGAWLVLYAYLRLEKRRPPGTAYEEAIRLATTSQRFVALP